MPGSDAPVGDARVGDANISGVLAGLDAIFAAHDGATKAEPYLKDALAAARQRGDHGAQLAILNEFMGLYRSLGRHDDSLAAAARADALLDTMQLRGTEAEATTLINIATAERAAGRLGDALHTYQRALTAATATMPVGDRRLAALHNNLSMLHSDAGEPSAARSELVQALRILELSSADSGADLDVATTLTNLSVVCHDLGDSAQAARHAERSLEIFTRGGHQQESHYAAALAGAAEAFHRMGRHADAVRLFRQARDLVRRDYGVDSEAYAVMVDNVAQAQAALAAATERTVEPASVAEASGPPIAAREAMAEPAVRGLDLARELWERHARPMLEERFAQYTGRIAAGMVGHGSEVYGYDDLLSRDHDFGPGLCLWLTAQDYALIGDQLQAAYQELPQTLHGIGPRQETPRASGEARRVGVFEISDFYERITGRPSAPPPESAHEWLMLEESTLAAATNGAVFADPLGAFGAVRAGFLSMPTDVRLALIARRLGMMAQAGQYNVPRMLDRADGEAAWLALAEFTRATASLVFLLNRPAAVGYLPYYKWHFAALRDVASRPASRLPHVHRGLSDALRAASAACFAGEGFGEGSHGAAPARKLLVQTIEDVCSQVVTELHTQRLSDSGELFLEHQRSEVQRRIRDDWLRNL
jgi:tetratricopeptide (TPR) repeat protein